MKASINALEDLYRLAYFLSISLISGNLKSLLATGNSQWKSKNLSCRVLGWPESSSSSVRFILPVSRCECRSVVHKNDRPQRVRGNMYFGRTKHGGKWQWIMGTTAALIARLILLQPLVMFTSLHERSQFSYNNPSSLPLVFFVTKHFLSLFACALSLKINISISNK